MIHVIRMANICPGVTIHQIPFGLSFATGPLISALGNLMRMDKVCLIHYNGRSKVSNIGRAIKGAIHEPGRVPRLPLSGV